MSSKKRKSAKKFSGEGNAWTIAVVAAVVVFVGAVAGILIPAGGGPDTAGDDAQAAGAAAELTPAGEVSSRAARPRDPRLRLRRRGFGGIPSGRELGDGPVPLDVAVPPF
jgi:hypothetical protein